MAVYLYLICQVGEGKKVSGPCKVGISENPAARLKNLRTASPHKLIIYELWDFESRAFAVEAERLAHASLKRARMSGEWFNIDPQLALGTITLWFKFAAEATAFERGDTDPLPPIPPNGVGMVANGRADQGGRIL